MKVGITGASGFVGQHLINRLRKRGHKPEVLARPGGGRLKTTVSSRPVPPDGPPDLRGLEALVNLAGESILARWTSSKKSRILASRIGLTSRLVEGIAALPAGRRPRVLVSASAVGFYGDCGESEVDEYQPAGSGFLSEVATQWEEAAVAADKLGVRVARVRLGIVCGADGGSFALQRRIFGAGLGGRLGSGRQWTSPVHVDDVARLIVYLLEHDELSGAFNAACPEPIRNADFTRLLAAKLGRPAILPAPAFALRALLGEASHILLDSTRAIPARTLAVGYKFRFPTSSSILDDVCAMDKLDESQQTPARP